MIYGSMNEHKYEVEGIKPQIMTEVTTLLHTLLVEGKFTKDDIHEMAKFACMSDEDVYDEAVNQLCSTTVTALNKMFDDATHGKQEAIDALAMFTDTVLNNMEDKK